MDDGRVPPSDAGALARKPSPSHVQRLSRSPAVAVCLGAIYPVIFLWAQNPGENVSPGLVMLIAALSVCVSLVGYRVLVLILRDRGRAGVITSLWQLAFFAYGHLTSWAGIRAGSQEETRVLVATIVATLLGSVLLARRVRGDALFRVLIPVLGILVAVNAVTIVRGGGVTQEEDVPTAAFDIDTAGLDPRAAGPPRDVYYLIFDRYAGERTLSELYDFDDAGFVQALRSRGFQVIDDALANYPQTGHSLASSLNMTHLQDLARRVGEDSTFGGPVYASLQDTTADRLFRSVGYRVVHVGSWWDQTAVDPGADTNIVYPRRSEFTDVFLRTTMLGALSLRLPLGIGNFYEDAHELVGFQLQAARDIATDPEPTFTFIHVLLPHPPYVFGADGRYLGPGQEGDPATLYLDQLVYANDQILRLVDDLVDVPAPERPIIVLQSDEGPYRPDAALSPASIDWGQEPVTELGRKLRILSAYYLPGSNVTVPQGITPVNSFRLVANTYMGGRYPMLDDTTYVFVDRLPFRFRDVTQELRT